CKNWLRLTERPRLSNLDLAFKVTPKTFAGDFLIDHQAGGRRQWYLHRRDFEAVFRPFASLVFPGRRGNNQLAKVHLFGQSSTDTTHTEHPGAKRLQN